MRISDSCSSARGEELAEADTPQHPDSHSYLFLTTVGVSMSRLLHSVVRMRFCRK